MVRPALTTLIGSPFKDGGRDWATGMDCWGLVMYVFERYGITLPDFKIRSRDFQGIDVIAHKAAGFSTWREILEPSANDVPLVVLMRIHPKYINHAGVYIDGDRIIHTTEATGVIISKRSQLKNSIAGFYQYVDNG